MNTDEKQTSNIYLKDGREKLMRGVNAVADAVKVTLGAAGANAVLESELMPGHLVTNDGVSIARMVVLDDPVENIGANLIKEVASRSDKESGDGTTTTTVLTQAILKEGMEFEGNPMELKRSLESCLPLILKSLEEQTKQIEPNEVAQVASVSAEDEKLGAIIQEIYEKIGKDGIIELDNSNLPTHFYEVSEGVRIRNAGFFGPYSMTEPGKAVYKKPLILVTKDKIVSTDELEGILYAVKQAGKNEMVIMCDDIDMSVASRLAMTHLQGGFKTLIIKAPTLWKEWILEDFARITGATVVGLGEGVSFKTARIEHLGTCDKIITTKDETRVLGIKDVSDYITELEKGSDDDKLRASWLKTQVAVLKLGASSDSELSYVRLKAEDARNAAYQALQHGIVPGGGIALFDAADVLPDTIGGNILRAALWSPVKQIIENAGSLQSVTELGDGVGFNAKNGEVISMWAAGIVDPSEVVKSAITNAISVAGIVLTAKVVVTLPKKNEIPTAMPVM